MKKSLATLATVVLLFAACGKEGEPEDSLIATGGSPSPTASAAADATATPRATATSAAATSAPAATSGGATATSAPVATAEAGKQEAPKAGRYVYTYTGSASNPTNPAAGQESFSGERYDEITHNGSIYTTESTNSESAGRTITRLRLSDTELEMLSVKIEASGMSLECNFSPPLTIARFPLKAETYPTQPFKGEGNACNGKVDITIQPQANQKDAGGRSYSTWPAKVRTEIRPEGLTIIQNETRWVSPDLGVEIRSESKQDGEFKMGTSTFKFSGTSTSVLKQTP